MRVSSSFLFGDARCPDMTAVGITKCDGDAHRSRCDRLISWSSGLVLTASYFASYLLPCDASALAFQGPVYFIHAPAFHSGALYGQSLSDGNGNEA